MAVLVTAVHVFGSRKSWLRGTRLNKSAHDASRTSACWKRSTSIHRPSMPIRFPYYEILREQYPCYWSESAKLWIISRYDDIVEAARDWETFSSSQGNMIDELPGRAGATLGTTDPPRHDRLRALSQAAFTRKTAEQFIPTTLEIADRALARIVENRNFEFINDFSSQITVGLLFRTMGLP